MSNFLTYKIVDGHEILEGNYMSSLVDGKQNCGSGKVFLEKVPSLFSFKNNKEGTKTNKVEIKKTDTQKTKLVISQNMQAKNKRSKTFLDKPNSPNATKNISNSTTKLIASNTTTETASNDVIVENESIANNTNTQNTIRNQPINLPWVLVGRENKLVKKIITNSKNISIDLFDNGTIDNDTIIVFDNKKLLVNKKRLSYKSIHLEFDFTENMREHEVIIVAHNMGTVPPNTALLLYKDGKSRQEYFITSTNKINAKILIVYEPPIQE
jgi:hypothetical protein